MMVSACRRCKAPIIWLTTKLGKSMPVDAASVRNASLAGLPVFDPKIHVSHFATCKFADYFRKVSKSKQKGEKDNERTRHI